jgi:hypothetical protein
LEQSAFRCYWGEEYGKNHVAASIHQAKYRYFQIILHEFGRFAFFHASAKGDFMVNGKYIFEVGGSNKNFSQIADLPSSYLAVDNIKIGFANKIPLGLFGFLY